METTTVNTRKPAGFWTKDPVVREIMSAYVLGDADLTVTTDLLVDHCEELGVSQPREAIEADVKWYARGFRKELGLPSIRETTSAAKAAADLAAQELEVGADG
jgi:hypothetical protein